MKTSRNKPYDYFAAMEQLRERSEDMSAEKAERLKMQVALNASDAEAAAFYVDLTGDDWAHIYPPVEKPEPISTNQAIDTFLNTYGKTSPQEEELLERLIFNPVPEYGTVLAEQDAEKSSENNSPGDLARMIKSEPKAAKEPEPQDEPGTESAQVDEERAPKEGTQNIEPAAEKKESPVGVAAETYRAPETSLSFELAKIFVKQGHFERAYDIISKINLNNPEKSIYFADQMRFLEKLIKLKNATRK